MLLSTAALGLTGAVMSSASAGEVEKSASFSGHVNRAVGAVDDGDNTAMANSDNGISMSRVRFVGEAASESLTTKAYIEVRARGASNANTNAQTGASLSMRHSYVSFTNNMGTLLAGQTDPAQDNVAPGFNSKSGASWLGSMVFQANPFGAAGFITSTAGNLGGAEETGLTRVSPVFNTTSGRNNVVRYTSPDMNGFSVEASISGAGTGSANESAGANIQYDADFDGTAVNFGASYAGLSGASATLDDMWDASLAVELASGINGLIGYGNRDLTANGRSNQTIWWAEVGYDMTGVSDLGGTSILLSYNNQDGGLANSSDYVAYNLNLSQSLADYGTTIYAGLSKQTYDIDGTNYDDIDAGWVGAKITF